MDTETVPRDFTRAMSFDLLRSEPDGDGLTFEGYAAVFDTPTTIDSWEGNFTEVVQRGAFRKTLREQTPVLMLDHGQHPLIGSMPLGQITTAKEDARGLFIRARLHDNWLIEPVRDAIASGAISGMSFRFRAIKDSWERPAKGLPQRTLLELSVPELGPVVFPAYRDTTASVRSALSALVLDDALRNGLLSVLPSTSEEAAPPSTSQEAAVTGEPAEATRRRTSAERRQIARRQLLKEKGYVH